LCVVYRPLFSCVCVGKADESTRKSTNPHVLVCLTTKNGAIGSSQMAVRSRQMKKQDKKKKKKKKKRFIDNMTDLLLGKREKRTNSRKDGQTNKRVWKSIRRAT
jgi:hypothetical protein